MNYFSKQLLLATILICTSFNSMALDFKIENKDHTPKVHKQHAADYVSKITDKDLLKEIRRAKMKSKKSLTSILNKFNSEDLNEVLYASAALISTREKGPFVTKNLKKLFTEAADQDLNKRFAKVVSLITVVLTFDSQKAGEFAEHVSKFLNSENFHEQYWALRAMANMKEGALAFKKDIIELASKNETNLSVRRNALLALGALGGKIGTEGFEVIAEGLNDYYFVVREAALFSALNLKDHLPEELKQTLVDGNVVKSEQLVLELAIVQAVLADNDQNIIIKAFENNSLQFGTSVNLYLLTDYVKFLRRDAEALKEFAVELLDSKDFVSRQVGATIVVALHYSLSDKELTEKAEKILEED